jgi:F-type H+-transporting ATPase subunit O
VETEIKRIASVVQKDKKLQDFLNNPVLSREQKSEGVSQLMLKYSELTKNFFLLLAENRHLNETQAIANAFLELTAAQRGEVTVIVTTAKVLV